MCNDVKSAVAPATLTVDALAKILHENVRGVVSRYQEWDDLPPDVAKVFRTQAERTLSAFVVLPLENTAACSGCNVLLDALTGLDEARREVVALKQKSDGLLERIDMMQREMCATEDSEGTPL